MKRFTKIASIAIALSFALTSAFAQNAESEVTEEVSTETSETQEVQDAQEASADGMYTVFSQVFTGGAFKKIEINLLYEDFILVSSGADSTMLEIRTNYKEKFPVVTQDGKNLKVSQTDKKANTLQGRKCTVKLTLPQNYPPVDFILSVQDGTAALEPFAAGNIKISASTGSITLEKVKADKTISVSMGDSTFSASNMEASSVSVTGKSGTLNIAKLTVEDFSISMDKGTAAFTLTKPFKKASSLEVGNGSIVAYMPSGTVFYDTLTVGKGNYRSDFASDSKGPELKAKFGKGTITVTRQ